MRSAGAHTIAAISTPPGGGERGVIRVSGEAAEDLLRAHVRGALPDAFPKRRCCFRADFLDGVGELPALVLWMPGPRSFTREDVVEFHLPGSPPLLARALDRLLHSGAKLAEPGEFTRRAFESGRIDLTQAEGVLELVEAANENERRAAVALLSGGLADRLRPLRETLDDLRALCEASLDFDSEDTGAVPLAELLEGFRTAMSGLREALSFELARVATLGRPRIVLAGAPNAGKSSLFNRLTGAGQALVTELRGTTRDVLESVWTLQGVECELADVAGLDAVNTGPDGRAQELSRDRREAADLLLWVVDATRRDLDRAALEAEELESGAARLLVWSQIDREAAASAPPDSLVRLAGRWCGVSAGEGLGLDELEAGTAELLGLSGQATSLDGAGITRELSLRHRASLEQALRELEGARAAVDSGRALEFVAEILRSASEALDGISGSTTPEDVLDRIFSRFCLGK